MTHLQQSAMSAIAPTEYSVRVYKKSDIHDDSYNGERIFVPLRDVTTVSSSQIQQVMTLLDSLTAQSESDHEMLSELASKPTPPNMTVSVSEPANVAATHIWVEMQTNGLTKGVWIRRNNEWFTLEPLRSSFTAGSVNGLINQQVPIDLPIGCKSLYFDRFQPTIHIVSKLGSLLGYSIAPRYIDPAGNSQTFSGVTPISTVSYPANTTQTPEPLSLHRSLAVNAVSALAVTFEPIGIPGSIRVNGTFTYYGIRG